MNTLRKCTSCDTVAYTTEDLILFVSHHQAKHGKKNLCNVCGRKKGKQWRTENKELVKELDKWNKVKSRYGITKDEYNTMFEKQNGTCKICKTHQADLQRGLVIDHCHDTGEVRGLLCDKCNKGLGFFEDNAETMLSAITYLTGARQKAEDELVIG